MRVAQRAMARRYVSAAAAAEAMGVPVSTTWAMIYRDSLPRCPATAASMAHRLGVTLHEVVVGDEPRPVPAGVREEADHELLFHGLDPVEARCRGAWGMRATRQLGRVFRIDQSQFARGRSALSASMVARVAQITGVSADWIATGVETTRETLDRSTRIDLPAGMRVCIEAAIGREITIEVETADDLGRRWDGECVLSRPPIGSDRLDLVHGSRMLERDADVAVGVVPAAVLLGGHHPMWAADAVALEDGMAIAYVGPDPDRFSAEWYGPVLCARQGADG